MNFLKGWTIETSKLPKYSEFNSPFRESIDATICDMIVKDKHDDWTAIHKTTKAEISPTITELKNMRARVKKNINTVDFKQALGLGRFYGKTACSLPRKIKHTLFKYAGMIDIDQHKGHPRVAVGLGVLNSNRFKNIEYYVENDKKVFAEMAEFYGIDITDKVDGKANEDRLKWYFNLTIYGGGRKIWIEGLVDPSDKDISKGYKPLVLKTTARMPFMTAFKDDCDSLKSLVWNSNPTIRGRLATQDDYGELEPYEQHNRCISYFMQIIENDALFHAYKFLKRDGFINGNMVSLESDGLCFPPAKPVSGGDIELLNAYVVKKTGFPIRYVIKPYGDENIYHDIIEQRNALGDSVLSEDDEEEMDADEIKYNEMKTEWEKTFVKIAHKDLYFYLTTHDPITPKSARQMSDIYQSKSYGYYLKKVDKTEWVADKARPKSFIQRWLKDQDIRTADGYGVYPPPQIVPENHINLWTKFPFQDLIEPYKYSGEGVEGIIGLIKTLCNEDDASATYLMKWLAHMIKYPADKIGVFPIFISDEGVGKGTLNKIIEKIVGAFKYFETSSPELNVWGKFNSLMGSAYVVVINEFGKKNQVDADGRIKNIITDTNMTIKGEGDKPFVIQSYHRFLGGTNDENPTATKKGDRRKWLIRCSDKLIKNRPYFNKMNAHINNPTVMRSFYDYLMSVECDDLRELDVPTTEYQKILQESNTNIIELFLTHITQGYKNEMDRINSHGVNDENEESTLVDYSKEGHTSSEVYAYFKLFKETLHIHNYECNLLALMRRLKLWAYSNHLITTKKGKKLNTTVFDFAGLIGHFKIGDDDGDDEAEDELPKGVCLIDTSV